MAVAGDTSATRQGILTLLESQENGPLCYWLASVLAEKVSDDGCRLLADMGLQRLSLERLNTTAAYCSTIVWPAVELFAWPPLASAT
jgi:hypothetical protein